MKHLIRPQHLGLGIAVGFWLYSVYTVGTRSIKPAEQDAAMLRNHCEMVRLYADTDGEYGWPDYNNTAHLCPAPEAPAGSGSNQRVEP